MYICIGKGIDSTCHKNTHICYIHIIAYTLYIYICTCIYIYIYIHTQTVNSLKLVNAML